MLCQNNTVISSALETGTNRDLISKTVLESISALWSRIKHSESMTQEFHSERYFYKTPHAQKGYRDVSPTQIYHVRSVIPGIKMRFFWPTYSNCAHHVLYLSTDISSGYLTRTKASKSKRWALMQCWCLIYLIQLFRHEKNPNNIF